MLRRLFMKNIYSTSNTKIAVTGCDDEAKAKLQHSSNTKIMKQKDIYDAMSCIDHMPISSCNNRRSVIFRLVYAIDVMYAFCRLTNTTRIQRSTHHQHYS